MGGAAPGRVREGGTPPAQPGGIGERCKLPHRSGSGAEHQKPTLALRYSENYAKKKRGMLLRLK